MNDRLKVRRIGNSLGINLPKDVLSELGVSEGDLLRATSAESGIVLSRSDEAFAHHMELVEELMERYPNTLRTLAE